MLRLIEAMDLVDEQDCALRLLAEPFACLRDDPSQVGHARGDGGYRLEVRLRERGDDAGERRLARTGRPPEDHRGELVRIDSPP